MKKIQTLVCLVLCFNIGFSQVINIEDSDLKACLIADSAINLDDDTDIDSIEAENATKVTCSNLSISSLAGLENFVNLKELTLSVNQIDSVNFSFASELLGLSLKDVSDETKEGLEYVNVLSNTNLQALVIFDSELIDLDVSKNENLEFLNINSSNISNELDVSNNHKLYNLICSNSLISSVNFSDSASKILTDLNIQNNKISALDLEGFDALLRLQCGYNNLSLLELNLQNIQRLNCEHNNLVNLSTEDLVNLERLTCDSNSLTQLDLSSNKELTVLNCDSNQLSYLNLRNQNNRYMSISAINNPKLSCIIVDSVEYSYDNWLEDKDSNARYSESCGASVLVPTKIEYKVFPNPAHNEFTISGMKGQSKILVINQLGRLVKTEETLCDTITLQLSTGLYFVTVSTSSEFSEVFRILMY